MAEPGIGPPLPLPAAAADCAVPYRVIACDHVTPTIKELWLGPLETHLEYLPGQYVLLEDREYALTPRSYSIANAPRPDGAISLLVTRIPDGSISAWIHDQVRVGEVVRISGPDGAFVDEPAASSPCLLLAAGSGLAPLRALLEAALPAGRRHELTLVFSARSEVDVISREQFASWETRHRGFRFIRTLTRGDGPPPHGRIPNLLVDLYDNLADHDVFIAGAPGFVTACALAADALDAARARIHIEVFFGEPQPWTSAPPQAEAHT